MFMLYFKIVRCIIPFVTHEEKEGNTLDKHIQMYGNTVLKNNIETDNLIELEYYKIVNKQNLKPYGIGIIKKFCDEIEVNVETREFNNIFKNEKDANTMLNLLLKNQVTPVTLKDILEDFVIV